MDGRGWGSLALESDYLHHQSRLISPNHSLTSRFFKHNNNNNNNVNNMKSVGGSNNQLFQGVDFPVNLNRSCDDDNKMVVGEVDFFSSHKDGVIRTVHHDDDHHHRVKEENSRDHHHHHPGPDPRPDLPLVNTGLHLLTTNTGSDQSTIDDGTSSDAEDKRTKNELAVLQAELERMNGENQKLKAMLSQVSHNYNTLQMHLVTLMQQQQQQQKSESTQQQEVENEERKIVPRQFLDLGPSAKNDMTSQTISDDEKTLDQIGSPQNNNMEVASRNDNKEIVLYDQGKNAREDSPEEDSDVQGQGWVPNKVARLSPPKGNTPVDQSTSEATMRKARVSVRARSEAPMISDGCQWRKYGQKMAKGNPCPRAYYRCTMAVGCPVRKQVQRCAEDRSILITTYEGNHNHPLPPAAMAMASTTSAAASMLLSGSMPSGDGLMNPNFLARTILPCSSTMATISASAPFPTVTLDLTHSPNPLHQLQRPTMAQPQPGQAQFPVPFPPSNGPALPPNFLTSMPHLLGQALYNHHNNNNQPQSKFSGLHTSMPNQNAGFADTLSAATAAITSDPNFTAALAAAISSIIGGAAARPADNDGGAIANNNGTNSTGNNNNNSASKNATSGNSMQQQ